MGRARRRARAVYTLCISTFLFVLLGPVTRAAAAEDACFDEIAKGLGSSYALLEVELQGKLRVYKVRSSTDCANGACDQVIVSHDQKALPTDALPITTDKKVTPGVVKPHTTGACKAKPAWSVTYSAVPEPVSGTCEQQLRDQSLKYDSVILVTDKGVGRILRAVECKSDCAIRYVTTAAGEVLPGMAKALKEATACTGGARYFDTGRDVNVEVKGAETPKEAADRQDAVLKAYRGDKDKATALAKDAGFALPALPGTAAAATSTASAAAGEVLQILGQIVVDRATEAAYQRAREELERLLGCPDAKRPLDPPLAVIGKKLAFPRTCRVVQTIRVQELAMSRAALLQALLQDVLLQLKALVPALPATGGSAAPAASASAAASVGIAAVPPPGTPTATASTTPPPAPPHPANLPLALDTVLGDMLPDISRVAGAGSSASTGSVVWNLLQLGLGHAGKAIDQCEDNDDACTALALAAVAVIQCRVEAMGANPKDRQTALVACQVEDKVESLADPAENAKKYSAVVLATAKTIASEWMSAQTAVTPEGAPDHRARARYAVHAAFDAGCLQLATQDLRSAKCPAELDPQGEGLPEDKKVAQKVASLARLLVVAAIDGDTNTVIAGLSKSVEIVLKDGVAASSLDPAEKKRLQRALRLLGAILQYAETFAKSGAKEDAAALHDRRTKILESLTREMTDRTGREDDAIFSLGGSLRAVGGIRIDPVGGGGTFFGPVSLPLGIGYQSAGNIHVELGLFDLGQYISFQESSGGLRVREPEPADVFAPSITVGRYWGKSFPIFIGLMAGYSPQYKFTKYATSGLGSVNFGLTGGVYVPLFDLN